MSIPNATAAYRTLIGTLRSQSSKYAFAPTRRSSRCFSSSSVAYVNLTRPTTRAATTSTTSTASKPIPTPTPAKATPAPKASTPTPAKSTPNITSTPSHRSLSSGLSDTLPDAAPINSEDQSTDWSRSFHGLSSTPFSKDAADALMAPINPSDVEIKPDGIIYLPEIKYRRILNKAFGPGGWGLAPRGETIVTGKSVTREYGLVVHGRLVSIARGEQQYFDPEGIPTATEGCKSNALMRCCKDLGIASELWDPVFIRKFKATHSKEVWVEHLTTKRKRKIHMRKDVNDIPGGYKAS